MTSHEGTFQTGKNNYDLSFYKLLLTSVKHIAALNHQV
jgi:hypothetical protein